MARKPPRHLQRSQPASVGGYGSGRPPKKPNDSEGNANGHRTDDLPDSTRSQTFNTSLANAVFKNRTVQQVDSLRTSDHVGAICPNLNDRSGNLRMVLGATRSKLNETQDELHQSNSDFRKVTMEKDALVNNNRALADDNQPLIRDNQDLSTANKTLQRQNQNLRQEAQQNRTASSDSQSLQQRFEDLSQAFENIRRERDEARGSLAQERAASHRAHQELPVLRDAVRRTQGILNGVVLPATDPDGNQPQAPPAVAPGAEAPDFSIPAAPNAGSSTNAAQSTQPQEMTAHVPEPTRTIKCECSEEYSDRPAKKKQKKHTKHI